jgi:hypothetical protein
MLALVAVAMRVTMLALVVVAMWVTMLALVAVAMRVTMLALVAVAMRVEIVADRLSGTAVAVDRTCLAVVAIVVCSVVGMTKRYPPILCKS